MSPVTSAPVAVHSPPPSLALPLRRLRGRLARWFWLDGMACTAWTVLGLAMVDFGLDWWLRFDGAQRAILLVLVLGCVGFIAWRRLLRPLTARLSDDALCLEVESRQRDLGQKLISALQLARSDDWHARGISRQLAQAVVDAGIAAATDADWSGVLDQRRERRNAALLVAALVAVVVGVGASIVSPLPGIWWRRNVLLANERWPQSTYLRFADLRDGRLQVPRGESFTVRVAVDESSQVMPERVQLEFRPARGRNVVVMNAVGNGAFEHQLQRVIEGFELRAVGGDAETEWTPVALVEPPALGQLQLEVTPPAYTKQSSSVLPAGAGPHSILEGSRCRLTAVANKPLESARLVHEHGEWLAKLEGDTQVVWELTEADVRSGRYSIYLSDTQGIRPQQPLTFLLQLQPDRAPRVEARLIGVGGSVLPQARLPLGVRIRDDFAVAEAGILWQSRGEGDATTAPPVPAALPTFLPHAGRAEVSFQDTFELAPLNLTPGRTLTFVVEAADNDARDGPNRGRSAEFLLRIVTTDELRADWLRREKEQRQELEQLLRTQEELLTDTDALAAAAPLSTSDRTAIAGLARRQKVVAQQIAAVAERLNAIAAEVVNNRLDAEPDRPADRLRRELVTPLLKVADEPAAEAEKSLDEARRTVDQDAPRQAALRTGSAAERRAVEQLRGILERMRKAEGFQEAVQLLYEIQKAQQDVYDRTQREKQQRIEAILQGTKKQE